MSEYVMFLDESGDHSLKKIDPQFPIFTLAGCIFDVKYYESVAVPKINQLKEKHFGSADIILHSYEIRKAKNAFTVLLNKEKRDAFILDMNELMSGLDFTIIAACIEKEELNGQYKQPSDPYDLAFSFVIERFVKFLAEKGVVGYFSVESRDPKSNRDLLETYDWYRTSGNSYCTHEFFNAHISKIEFVRKDENINGHQIADLVAYPTGRFCSNTGGDNPAFEVLKPKFRKHVEKVSGYGYKVFP
jgi:Protein of unknown function (DUF3800)